MKRTILAAITLLLAISLQAQKRVNNHMYNPDPAPVVSGDRLYVFTGHDLDTATYFRMPDWQLFSTTDMEHWTDHGVVMTTANFKWAKQGDNAWASQAIERNGKWYWYVAAEDTTKHLHGIGVAVADRPEGPWTDPIGKPLIPGDWGFIDPTVFIDDDGQAYLFWGNNGCWYAKLNEDMISIDKSFANNGICDMRAMLDDEAQFGPKCMKMDYQLHKRVMKTGFEEAPWLYKIGDTYFLEYAAGGVPEHWAYSTSKSIHGPWHYEGRITDESPGSFTIHGGTIDFKGKSYLFYHDGIPSGGNGFRRTTAFREFQRLKDGRIPKIDITADAQGTEINRRDHRGKVVYQDDEVVFRQIDEHTWIGNGHLVYNESLYLVEGNDHAILIDAGTYIPELDKIVAKITSKPVTMMLTHAHGDHVGGVGPFPEVYLNAGDMPMVPNNLRNYKGQIKYLYDGEVIDLGGREIEVIFTPGHTAGSATFFDKAKHYGFSGDAFGSTNLLVFTNLSTEMYTAERIENYMKKNDIHFLFPGHYSGDNLETLQRVTDIKNMCREVLDGERKPTISNGNNGGMDMMVDDNGVRINFSSRSGMK